MPLAIGLPSSTRWRIRPSPMPNCSPPPAPQRRRCTTRAPSASPCSTCRTSQFPWASLPPGWADVPYVPLNYRLAEAEIDALLKRITPAYLVTDITHLTAFGDRQGVALTSRGDFLGMARGGGGSEDYRSMDPDSVGVLLFTSGTTGAPKAAVLRHKHLVSYIFNSVEFGAADENDAALVCVPPVSRRRHRRGAEFGLFRPTRRAARQLQPRGVDRDRPHGEDHHRLRGADHARPHRPRARRAGKRPHAASSVALLRRRQDAAGGGSNGPCSSFPKPTSPMHTASPKPVPPSPCWGRTNTAPPPAAKTKRCAAACSLRACRCPESRSRCATMRARRWQRASGARYTFVATRFPASTRAAAAPWAPTAGSPPATPAISTRKAISSSKAAPTT